VKIGFIGVITTETPSTVTASGVAGVKFTDEVEAINKYAKELKEKGIKSIVVLAHNPGTSATDGSMPTGEVVEFVNQVDDEVDVIFGAHDHKYLNSTVDGKLLVQSYSYGTAFSDINLTINPDTQNITAKSAQIVTTFQTPEFLDEGVQAELNAYMADIAPIINEEVGDAVIELTRTANETGESHLVT
jgi:2',3'-cyclic-nucleotide 2'-phosphodiesterase / 3'-nucleotidase / 5'-nucleotidase